MKPRSVIAAAALVLALLPAQAFAGSVRLDPSFGDGGLLVRPPSPERSSSASDMAIGPDGRIVVLGSRFVSGQGESASAFGFEVNGRIDSSFGARIPA